MTLPKKSFGQHFLHDQGVVKKIVAAAEIATTDLVLEVGPGTGVLTRELQAVQELILIEADRDLIASLAQEFPQAKIINQDAASINYDDLTNGRSWIFVSNLPYNSGNAIVMQVLMSKNPPRHLVVMLQKEVGERMLFKPGAESVLGVATQLYAKVEKICKVAPGAFNPPPKVESVVLKLTPINGAIDREAVIRVAKIGFGNRRKQLHKNLEEAGLLSSDKTKEILVTFGLSPLARAEDLSLDNWVELANAL